MIGAALNAYDQPIGLSGEALKCIGQEKAKRTADRAWLDEALAACYSL